MRNRALRFWAAAALAAAAVFLPRAAAAQSAIAGSVSDASGALMPGVTVEVSSPALIEKTRAATTDGAGNTGSSICGLACTW